jgi:hypothetical protein
MPMTRSPVRTAAEYIRRGSRQFGKRQHPRMPAAVGSSVLIYSVGMGIAMLANLPIVVGMAIVIVTGLLAVAVSALILGWP